MCKVCHCACLVAKVSTETKTAIGWETARVGCLRYEMEAESKYFRRAVRPEGPRTRIHVQETLSTVLSQLCVLIAEQSA